MSALRFLFGNVYPFLHCFPSHFFSFMNQARRLQGQLGRVCPCHLPGLPPRAGAWVVASVPAALCPSLRAFLSALSRCPPGGAGLLRSAPAAVLQEALGNSRRPPPPTRENKQICLLCGCPDIPFHSFFIEFLVAWIS